MKAPGATALPRNRSVSFNANPHLGKFINGFFFSLSGIGTVFLYNDNI